MSDKVRAYVLDELQKKGPLPEGIDIDAFNYIASGHVDSMGVIKFIMDIEAEFDVELSPEETQSRSFRTVGGLIAIIDEKMSG